MSKKKNHIYKKKKNTHTHTHTHICRYCKKKKEYMLPQFLSQSIYHNNYLLNNKKNTIKNSSTLLPTYKFKLPHIKKKKENLTPHYHQTVRVWQLQFYLILSILILMSHLQIQIKKKKKIKSNNLCYIKSPRGLVSNQKKKKLAEKCAKKAIAQNKK